MNRNIFIWLVAPVLTACAGLLPPIVDETSWGLHSGNHLLNRPRDAAAQQ